MFIAVGVETFGGRAERELLATGEHVRKRRLETGRSSPLRRLRSHGSRARAVERRDRRPALHQSPHD
jgi:hypothetical protein